RWGGIPRVERKPFGLGSSTVSGASWKGVGWRQKRSKQLISKKLTETPYFRSIKQLRWIARTFLGRHCFTPTSGSWVNQVERWFAEITNKRIRRGTFDSGRSLQKTIGGYLRC